MWPDTQSGREHPHLEDRSVLKAKYRTRPRGWDDSKAAAPRTNPPTGNQNKRGVVCRRRAYGPF